MLYNHGSAPGMLNSKASAILGPLYVNQGFVFFMPYRRGQGLSQDAGTYIGDEIEKAKQKNGDAGAVETLVQLLKTDHLDDQMAALRWLKKQNYILTAKIAVAGNSFGGIEVVLGADRAAYCAAIDALGGAETWATAPELQTLMKDSVRNSKSPIFFFQAENDFDLAPSRVLSAESRSSRLNKKGPIFEPDFEGDIGFGHSFGEQLNLTQLNCA
ncbi:MAG: dienelactone hydrolase family protein [Bdellovibrionales bacterium]|nr:dienelactone hydrolase family protein [Oligoflexia bacterium]